MRPAALASPWNSAVATCSCCSDLLLQPSCCFLDPRAAGWPRTTCRRTTASPTSPRALCTQRSRLWMRWWLN